MKSSKRALKDKSYRFVEDLTKTDLEEKQRWKQEVGDLYKKGIKLRFVGGMWKSRAGKLAPFYKESPEPDYPEGQELNKECPGPEVSNTETSKSQED